MQVRTRAIAALAASIPAAAAIIAIGGPLDPPAGPVASSYKTLAEVEPRIAINAANTPGDADSLFRISAAGSYYLTANISVTTAEAAIEVTASNVTIDLNGFRLLGNSTALSGVRVSSSAVVGLTVRNGTITGWGADGIDAANADDSRFEELTLNSNGGDGLECGKSARISDCAADSNAASGFRTQNGATFTACTARSNANHGFMVYDPDTEHGLSTFTGCTSTSNTEMGFSAWKGGNLTGCRADLNGSQGIGVGAMGVINACSAIGNARTGIMTMARRDTGSLTGNGLSVVGCTASENGDDGIDAFNGRTIVTNCVANYNVGNGIRSGVASLILNNVAVANGTGAGEFAGIYAAGADNRIEGNNVSANDRGIEVFAAGNLIIANSASGNTTNYEIGANNVVGTIIQGALSPAISGATGGSGIGSTNPWANISF